MDIETSKNDNNLDESYEEDNFEMNSEIIEEKTTPENYSTDEYNNIIMYDSDIDDCYRSFEEDLNEESRCDKNNYENFNECDEDIEKDQIDKITFMTQIFNVVEKYVKKHPIGATIGGEYVGQDDDAQVDAINLFGKIMDIYAEFIEGEI